MRIYVVTSDGGGVVAAGTDEGAVKNKVEAKFAGQATEFEWRPEWNGATRLCYRMTSTGRWNKNPAYYFEAVEVS